MLMPPKKVMYCSHKLKACTQHRAGHWRTDSLVRSKKGRYKHRYYKQWEDVLLSKGRGWGDRAGGGGGGGLRAGDPSLGN